MSAAYDFHPEARVDLREIVDYIADDNPDAADNVLSDILRMLVSLARLQNLGHSRTDLTSRPLRFITVAITSLPTCPTSSLYGWLPFCTATVIPASWRQFCAAGKTGRKALRGQAVITADPSDNRILECALEAKSDFIVSGDTRHVLPFDRYGGIQIVRVVDFLEVLKQV